jgi:4-amino-4-deoxy-L-arabinose transferase-like glycosyltransferase
VRAAARAPLALLFAALAGFALIRAPFLSVPLERDEGDYAYIAQRMLEGDVPYRDAFDQKPPGVYVAYATAFVVFGESIEGIRILLWVATAAAAFALHALVRVLAGPLAAAFALLVFALASGDPNLQGHAANTENWMLLPLVLAALAAVTGWREGGRWRWLACGGCAALACWLKQVAVTDACLYAAAIGGDAVIGRPGPTARELARRGALFVGGAALVSTPVLLYFAAHGAFAAFVDAVFLHNLEYAQASSIEQGLENLAGAIAFQAPSLTVVWALALLGWLLPQGGPARMRYALGLWWLVSLAGTSLGLYFRPHYFLQALPALSALAGVGAAGLAARAAAPATALRRATVAGLAVVVFGAPLAVHRATLCAASPDAIARRLYGFNPFPESLVIAEHIRHNSHPDDRVFIVGSEPQILFHAQRRSATRYILFYPLTGDYSDARARQQEVLDEVRAARPLYVVWADVSTSLLRTPKTEPLIFDATTEMLARDYELELLARPDAKLESYAFDHGEQARRWLQAARSRGWDELPRVALYRRVR